MLYYLRPIALLALVLLSIEAQARDYVVEAIVFSNSAGASSQSEEVWDAFSQRTQNTQTKISGRYARAKTVEHPLSLDSLAGIRHTLSRSPDYRVLYSGAWTQSEASYAQSPLIQVDAQSLVGAIRVYAPNLLFAEINLQYAPTLAGQVASEQAKFFLDEKRKLKLNETHYFDHPNFGVILRVAPRQGTP